MKKWVISLCLMMSAVQANAFHYHNHTITKTPAKTMQQHPMEDFTGTWQGTCSNQNLEFDIKQTEKHITLKITEDGEPMDSETFALNQIVTETHSVDFNQSMIKYAQLYFNYLNLWMSAVQVMEGGGSGFELVELFMVKQGDTLILRDDEGTPCELKKAA